MPLFKILIYEDSDTYVEGLKFNIRPMLKAKGIDLKVLTRINGDTLAEDMEFIPHLVIVDYDLGDITGEEIIAVMNGDPQMNNSSIILCSGGESRDFLQSIADKYECGVACYIKDGDELANAILNKGLSLKG